MAGQPQGYQDQHPMVANSIPVTAVTNDTAPQPESPAVEEVLDTAPAVMMGRNRWTQYKALMQKHVNSYTRQTEVIRSEVATSVIYLVMLFLFGLTASVQKEPSNVAEWHSNFTVTTSIDAQQNLSFDMGFQEYCKTGPCFLAFGDVDEGAGCSPALSSFMQKVGLCAFSSSPSFAANNSKFKEQTGSNYVSCKCAKPRFRSLSSCARAAHCPVLRRCGASRLRDFAFLREERIGGAVEFTSLPGICRRARGACDAVPGPDAAHGAAQARTSLLTRHRSSTTPSTL
eukprot:3887967-Rhodomonas_salina.3